MTDDLPDLSKVYPAVEHLMGTLDHDAGTIQGIADRLTQGVGANLEDDKARLAKVKSRLSFGVSNSIKKKDDVTLNGIAGRMRSAVAQSVDADQEHVDRLVNATASLGALVSPAPLPPIPTIPRPAQPQPSPTATDWYCYNAPPVPGGLPAETIWLYPAGGDEPVEGPPGWPPRPQWGPSFYTRPPFGYVWVGPTGRIATCGDAVPPPVPIPVPPPVPNVLPPPVPPPVPPPGTCPPCPVPVPQVSHASCGPLPDGLPGARVYLIPWLDPGDSSPSTYSDCGQKLVKESMYSLYPAQRLADAVSVPDGWADFIGGIELIEDPEDTSNGSTIVSGGSGRGDDSPYSGAGLASY